MTEYVGGTGSVRTAEGWQRKEKDMEREPKSGELYRHFKNKLYQIVAVATHSETREKLVIYQALYGDYQVYARPLEMFVSEVDHEKYPEVTQRYRFERVDRAELAQEELGEMAPRNVSEQAAGGRMPGREAGKTVVRNEPLSAAGERMPGREAEPAVEENGQKWGRYGDEVNPKLMAFLDADELEDRYNILISMRDEVDDHMINSMAVVLDVVIPEGEVSDRYEQLKSCIRTKQRYETLRLR